MSLKLGYKASAEQFGPRELVEYAVKAEAAGFDSVVVSDHLQPWRHNGGHAPFSLSWLAAVGERTKHVELGISVLTPTFRYHPVIVAQAMATLGSLYPDRVWLGIGTGESMNEVPLGFDWPDSKERFARMKEAAELIRRLWSEERVTFDGSYYKTRRATIYDRPEAPIPLYIAASGPSAAKLAGRIADGFICTSGKGRDLYTDTLLPKVREGAESVGRDVGAIELAIELKVSFDTDATAAYQNTRHWAALALSPDEKVGVEDPIEMERRADALPLDRAASRWIVGSDPDEQVAKIQDYIDMGFTHLIFHGPGSDQERFIKLYSQLVFPRLKIKTGSPAGAVSAE